MKPQLMLRESRRGVLSQRRFCAPFVALVASLFILVSAAALFADTGALEGVVVQLPWKHQFQFAGFYAAIEQGFYEREGLDVELREIAPGVVPVEEVTAGRADFGVARSEVILERLTGTPLVALAAILQHSPSIMLARADSGIFSPAGLVGKRVILGSRRLNAAVFAMLRSEGVDPGRIIPVEPSYTHDLEDFAEGRIDAISAYITSQPFQLLKRGVPFLLMRPITYGVDFYGDCLFTSEQEINAHPERTRSFLEATLEGWKYAFEHTEEIIDIILDTYTAGAPDITRGFLTYESREIRRLVMPDLVEIGHMSRARWEQIAATFERLGMVDGEPDLDGFLYSPESARFDWNHWSLKLLGGIIVLLVSLFPTFFYGKLKREIRNRRHAEETLRKSEERFRELAELLPEAVFEADLRLNLTFANRRAFELFGYTAEDFERGLNGLDMVTSSDRDLAEENFARRLNGNDFGVVEYTARTREGKTFPMLLHIGLVLHDGTPIGVRGIIMDITDRKRAEQEKARLEEQFHQAQRLESVGRLAGGVAHDLNNLLTPILGYGEMILEEDVVGNSRITEPADEIVRAARRARDLVRQLLAFSRKQTLRFEILDLNALIRDFQKLLRRTVREDIVIHEHLAGALPTVRGDRGQLEQVVMNLAVNAQDAMPAGGNLTIETARIDLDEDHAARYEDLATGSYLTLSISDTGCGMDEQTRRRLFEPFFTTKERERGTGLGLATVYGIVKQHGGDILVESEEGRGSVFTVYLPVASDPSVTERLGPKNVSAPVSRGRETILIVEDNTQVRDLTAGILKRQGYAVLAADAGEQALALLSAYDGPVHLVLTDVVMPGMNGSELFQRVTALHPEARALYMSGYTEDVLADQRSGDAAPHFIHKPFAVRDLTTKVRQILDEDARA